MEIHVLDKKNYFRWFDVKEFFSNLCGGDHCFRQIISIGYGAGHLADVRIYFFKLSSMGERVARIEVSAS